MIGNKYMVAMGTYYSKKVGKSFVITLSSGKQLNVIVGDIKKDIHTDKMHQYAKRNKDIVEFIVDTRKMNVRSLKLGNIVEFKGKIIKIQEVVK